MKIYQVEHPLIFQKLTKLRNKETNVKEFREHVVEISKMLAYEVLKNVKTKSIDIETPLAKTIGLEISQEINLFPILRAGLGMLEGFTSLIPFAKIGHIGLYRDEKTLEPIKYLFKVPKGSAKNSLNIILDPMLATGGTICAAVKMMKSAGFENIIVVSILSSNAAIKKIKKENSGIKLYVVSIDKILSKSGYILPGLGDAGDRMFGTK